MDKINFGSTYRIKYKPASEIQNAKLKKFAAQFQNNKSTNANSNLGFTRISVRQRLDERVEQGLKRLGFNVFQKFERNNIPTSKMDTYIKDQLNTNNYTWIGKQNPKKLIKDFED